MYCSVKEELRKEEMNAGRLKVVMRKVLVCWERDKWYMRLRRGERFCIEENMEMKKT